MPRFLQLLGPFLKPVLSNEVSGELSGKENEGVKPAVREICCDTCFVVVHVWLYSCGAIFEYRSKLSQGLNHFGGRCSKRNFVLLYFFLRCAFYKDYDQETHCVLMFQCFDVSMCRCIDVSMYRCFNVSMFQCIDV